MTIKTVLKIPLRAVWSLCGAPRKIMIRHAIYALFVLVTLLGLAAVSRGAAPAADFLVYLPFITSPPVPVPFGSVYTGEGTFYNATGEGNCGFPASPNNLMVAAMNQSDYNNAALCGAYVQAAGPNGAVIVRIVDSCPECAPGDVDFSQEAFVQIADLVAGRVPISWQLVSYPLSGPIVYHFKDGSNQWWTAVQIRNHSNPIAKLEVLDGNGVFQEIPRTSYNYFVAESGLGPGPYTFRVTDVFGQTITDSGIPHVENGDVSGSAQFPPP